MKSLLDAQDGDSVFGEWEIPGTEIVFEIQPGMSLGRFLLKRNGVEDPHLTERMLIEFSGHETTAAVAHAIARRIQEIEAGR
jgi:hypothetical protein